jgi:methyl-accepting chemotaxis protein
MKANGKLANRALFASVTIIMFLLVIGGVTQRMLTNQKKVTAAEERRYQSRLLADELRQSSDDLTRLARTYVVTADKRYEEQYWAVLDIRNGKAPRPENYDRIYWDFMAADEVKPRPDGRVIPLQQLMEELGFSAEEFAKLKEAQTNSDNLVRMETVAMNAVKGLFDDGFGQFSVKGEPNLEMARQLMHSREYHAEKARIMRPIDEFLEKLERRTSGDVQLLVQQAYRLFYTLLALVILAVLTLVALCISIFATVVRPIRQVMGELQNTSLQLDAASAQMALSNQTLSSGASELAASVEETSASLEEMSSMIQATAENCLRAKALASETRLFAEGGSGMMGEMVEAMAEIDSSTAQVAKIVKDIDEIAFQTNILALNAAVEAARAGKAGEGFAVVADEVRSLAQRSAAAAKATAHKIEVAINSTRKGSQCTTRVGDSLEQITKKVVATDSLVGEIATAAREQALGVKQINQAIGQMEKVSQGNAANAEETAASAEQVEAEGEVLNELVGHLRVLAGVGANHQLPPGPPPSHFSRTPVRAWVEQTAERRSNRPAGPLRIGGSSRLELPPVSSSDEGNFRDF